MRSKPKRGTPYDVIESDGVLGGIYEVKNVLGFTDGKVMVYDRHGEIERVFVPNSYIPLRVNGSWWIGKNVGNNSAAHIVVADGNGTSSVQTASPVIANSVDADCPGADCSRILASNILHRVSKSTRKQDNKWLWIIGGAVVAVIIIIIMRGGL